jgi:hypothetical protein
MFTVAIFYLFYPAKTFEDPSATEVHPEIASPTRPTPLPFIKTLDEPEAIGAL